MCLFRQCSSGQTMQSLLNNYNKQIRRYYITHATFSNIRVNTGDITKASLHILNGNYHLMYSCARYSVRMNTSNELYKRPMNKFKFSLRGKIKLCDLAVRERTRAGFNVPSNFYLSCAHSPAA